MNRVADSLLLLLGSVPYWLLGLPWVVGTERVRWSPLLGCALAGLFAEWAMMAHLPVRGAVSLMVLASGAVAVWRARATPHVDLREALLEWIPLYLASALAVSLIPFPIVGSWSGDWYLTLRAGEAVVSGALPTEMLKRPPLFGAAAAPLWVLGQGLAPLQIFAAVASAATLLATHQFVRWLRAGVSLVWLLPLILSPFYLHHTAAVWAKLMAGAFVLLAVMEALRGARMASAVAFALAVATHEGFIIWLPFVLICHGRAGHGWRAAAAALPSLAIAGILLAGPIVIWAIVTHGLGARIAANPVVTTHALMAEDTMNPALRVVLSVVTAFIGWAPIEELSLWIHRPNPLSAGVVAKEIYWVVCSWISTLAGTMIGFLFPFLVSFSAASRSLADTSRPASWPVLDRWLLLGLAVAVVLNGALSGVYCSWGMMQAALSPLALGSYAVLVAALASPSHPVAAGRVLRRVSWTAALFGTLPWLLVNAGTTLGLWLSAGFRERFAASSESDYTLALQEHVRSLGMIAFPLGPVLCLAALMVFWALSRSPAPGGQGSRRE